MFGSSNTGRKIFVHYSTNCFNKKIKKYIKIEEIKKQLRERDTDKVAIYKEIEIFIVLNL